MNKPTILFGIRKQAGLSDVLGKIIKSRLGVTPMLDVAANSLRGSTIMQSLSPGLRQARNANSELVHNLRKLYGDHSSIIKSIGGHATNENGLVNEITLNKLLKKMLEKTSRGSQDQMDGVRNFVDDMDRKLNTSIRSDISTFDPMDDLISRGLSRDFSVLRKWLPGEGTSYGTAMFKPSNPRFDQASRQLRSGIMFPAGYNNNSAIHTTRGGSPKYVMLDAADSKIVSSYPDEYTMLMGKDHETGSQMSDFIENQIMDDGNGFWKYREGADMEGLAAIKKKVYEAVSEAAGTEHVIGTQAYRDQAILAKNKLNEVVDGISKFRSRDLPVAAGVLGTGTLAGSGTAVYKYNQGKKEDDENLTRKLARLANKIPLYIQKTF